MTAEFTGERVVPGQVDVDLWNEHVARYAFASRLCRNRRVLDAGCGTGYGTLELAFDALHITGIDSSPDAIFHAREYFSRPNLDWLQGSVTMLPLATAAFDLVVSFEVIEHLENWQELVEESKRVLAPGGQFVVSTPNTRFYTETRRDSGPNPFHAHEFEYEEFQAALERHFSSVSLFVEDHTEGILFRSIPSQCDAEVRLESSDHDPHESNFFIAVCATTAQNRVPAFVYIPRTANLLKERNEHVDRLRTELNTKDEWLAAKQIELQKLLALYRELAVELEKSNAWATELDTKLIAAGEGIVQLQTELASEHSAYEARLSELTDELSQRTLWAKAIDTELTVKTGELARAVELLHNAESTVHERTKWALDLQRERDTFQGELAKVKASRWIRLGRAFGLGPEISKP